MLEFIELIYDFKCNKQHNVFNNYSLEMEL